jgi:DNA-binding transcriptional regulator YdaS (Cro superfamily)
MEMSEVIRRAGGLVKLAKAVGRHHATILGWTSVPPKHVRAVAAATQIPPHELRPDLWDAPDAPPPANDTSTSKPKARRPTRSAGAAASPSSAEPDKAEAA